MLSLKNTKAGFDLSMEVTDGFGGNLKDLLPPLFTSHTLKCALLFYSELSPQCQDNVRVCGFIHFLGVCALVK